MIGWQDLLGAARKAAGSAAIEAERRRAVSGLYYALFQRCAAGAAAVFAGAGPEVEARTRRALSHTGVRKVCDAYERAGRLGRFDQAGLEWHAAPSPEMKKVAQGFALLQDGRVTADYDLLAEVTEVLLFSLVDVSDAAHGSMDLLAGSSELAVLLAALLLHDRWTRRG